VNAPVGNARFREETPVFRYTRREDDGRGWPKVIVPCVTRQAAVWYLGEEGHSILVGVGEGGPNANRALVEPEMIHDDDGETEKGLVWNVYSVNENDPHDIRDGEFYSSEGGPEEALWAAEEWAEELRP